MTTARVVTAVTCTVTTFIDITGLTFTLAANTDYRFRAVLHHSVSATTIGIRFAVNCSATPVALRVGGMIPISTVAANFGSQTAFDTAIFASTTGTTTAVMSIIEGYIRNGTNGGTFAIRVGSESNVATAVTVLANSYAEVVAA